MSTAERTTTQATRTRTAALPNKPSFRFTKVTQNIDTSTAIFGGGSTSGPVAFIEIVALDEMVDAIIQGSWQREDRLGVK